MNVAFVRVFRPWKKKKNLGASFTLAGFPGVENWRRIELPQLPQLLSSLSSSAPQLPQLLSSSAPEIALFPTWLP